MKRRIIIILCMVLSAMMIALTACVGSGEASAAKDKDEIPSLLGKRYVSDTGEEPFDEKAEYEADDGEEAFDENTEYVAEEDDEEEESETSGEENSGQSTADKLDSMLNDSSEDVGTWKLFTVSQHGRSYMEDELKSKGIEAWIEMNADGTGRINLVGTLMDMEWKHGSIHVFDNGEGESEDYRYSMNGAFLVLVDEDMTLAFRKVED